MSAPALNVAIQGQGEISADNCNTFVQSTFTAISLRAFIGVPGMCVFVQGTSAPGDNGAGTLAWNPTGTGPDDGGITNIVPVGVPVGCWTRVKQTSVPANGVVTVPTIAALRALPAPALPLGSLIYTLGYTSVNDGLSGPPFISTSVNPGPDNGGTIIHSNTAGLYYVRQYTGAISLGWFGPAGDGVTDDTAVFNAWLAAIQTSSGYIPPPSVSYALPNGISICGYQQTQILSSPIAVMNCGGVTSATVSTSCGGITSTGYAITLTNCELCDFNFPVVQTGYSGVMMNTTSPATQHNRVGITRLQGTGRQATKPADPMANRVGFTVLGGVGGLANYYHILTLPFVSGFDTSVAFYTPIAVGFPNANANVVNDLGADGYWFGLYSNSNENQSVGAFFTNSTGTDAAHYTEAIRIGDGTLATFNNSFSGACEPGAHSRGAHCLVGSFGNKIYIQDNCDLSVLDDANANDIITHNSWSLSGSILFATTLATAVYTFATLPPPVAGRTAMINDSTLPFTGANIGSTMAGGGTFTVKCYCDSTPTWRIG